MPKSHLTFLPDDPEEIWKWKHGESRMAVRTPEYMAWCSMISRCYNKNSNRYKHYGARGLGVCPEWRYSYPTFLHDMGRRPSDRHSLNRIDNEKGYSKENCAWSTDTEQNRNKRTTVRFEFNGKNLTQQEWADEIGISVDTLRSRLRRWPVAKALTAPLGQYPRTRSGKPIASGPRPRSH